ncbi:MAG: DUF1887 family protein [Clostridia bacterium]|nr:DUF1887 family protein [Clostridia bacterium]
MKTLIELFDSEHIYNYLAATVFRPQKVCFLGDYESLGVDVGSASKKYASLMGLDCHFSFVAANSNDYDELRRKLRELILREERLGNECTVDVTGGRDLALVATGSMIPNGTQVIYYDREMNAFRFLGTEKTQKVDIALTCEAFITVAGGAIYSGARNRGFDDAEWKIIRDLVKVYFENKEEWNKFVKYLQQVAKGEDEKVSDNLNVDAPFSFKDGNGKTFTCNEKIMSALVGAGAIRNLLVTPDRKWVGFTFVSGEMANLLVNEGVWLELAVYLAAKESNIFSDVQTSVKFVWDIPSGSESLAEIVSDSTPRNEVDVMMTRGVLPVFVSCKTRVPTNDDINEIYAIKKKFGGDLAAGILATTKYVADNTPIRERAEELGISIIDERDFKNEKIVQRLEKLTELK